jgi:putative peptidoglycan lipid II flippase
MVFLLRRGARDFGEVARFDDRFARRLWRIVFAAVIMAAGLWITAAGLAPFLAMPWWRVLALMALITVGAVIYFGSGQLIGAFRLSEFRAAMRRGD